MSESAMTDTAMRVMVVDDHPMWRDAVGRDLGEAGFEVVAAIGEGVKRHQGQSRNSNDNC